jgi:hypothetical protein
LRIRRSRIGISWSGSTPTTRIASAVSRSDIRAPWSGRASSPSSPGSTGFGELSRLEEPAARAILWTSQPSSLEVPPPTSAADRSPLLRMASAVRFTASSQEIGVRLPSPARTMGRLIRSPELNIWNANRPLSQSQPSSTAALSRAFTRSTRSSRTVKPTLHWLGQRVQIEPACSMSQGRARKR